MQKTAYVQVSLLTFFQFVVVGAYNPLLGTYLKDTLGFTGAEVGTILTVFQLAGMAAPLAAAFFVDRVVSARILFGGLHLVGAVLAVGLMTVKDFWPFLGLFGVYAFIQGPTGGLVNALIFARMPDRQGQYGGVRLWGTVGWIASAAILSALWLIPGVPMSWMFGLTAAGGVAGALGALTLPRTAKAVPPGPFRLFPKEAFAVFLRPSILRVGFLFLLSAVLDRFYFIATAPYLKQLGFADSQTMVAMTLGQVTEVALLLLTGPVLKRWGLRNTFLLGLGVQVVRFAVLAANPGPWALVGALSLNGFVFAFFYAVVTIFVDTHTETATRGGVHQLMGLFFGGTASVIGSLTAGLAFDWFRQGAGVNYQAYWLVPLGLAVAVWLLTWVLVPRQDSAAASISDSAK